MDKANKRASIIRSTLPEDSTCYFVTLSYRNEFVPYVTLAQIAQAMRELRWCKSTQIAIRRDYDFTSGHGSRILREGPFEVGYIDVEQPVKELLTDQSFQSLSAIQRGKYHYDTSYKVSVAFNRDNVLFINRLRKKLHQFTGSYNTIKYFYAPEYGPTTSRFHIHLLIWCTSEVPIGVFKNAVVDCWPYADPVRTYENCQVARCAASYVSEYVNCSADVSPLLLALAPLRPSRSLGLGFDLPEYSLRAINPAPNKFNFDFDKQFISKDGMARVYHMQIPSRVAYAYFPKCKGFSRLSSDAVVSLYSTIQQMPELRCKVGYRGLDDLYQLPVRDIYGGSIAVTQSEYKYFRNRLLRCTRRYTTLFNCSPQDYFKQIYEFYSRFALRRYYLQMTHPDYHGFMDFDNMDSLLPTVVPLNQLIYDCNSNPVNISVTKELVEKFNSRIKQRKLNYIPYT